LTENLEKDENGFNCKIKISLKEEVIGNHKIILKIIKMIDKLFRVIDMKSVPKFQKRISIAS
jgi:hypothetical protein